MHGLNAQTGQSLTGLAHLRQSIRDILMTPIGSRVMRRDYGSRIPDLIDQPITPRLTIEVVAAVGQALRRWEPRIELLRVRIEAAVAGKLTLALEFRYRPNGQILTLTDLEIAR